MATAFHRSNEERPLTSHMYQSPPQTSILDITVIKARINPEVANPQTKAWFIFSVDGCREPISTPARQLSDPMMFGTPARFTFIPNQNPYLYVTLCVFDAQNQMVPLARSRSRLANMPFGSQFSVSLMSTADKSKEIGQIFISGTLTQPQETPEPTPYPGYAQFIPDPSNPYAGAPQTGSAPSSNPYGAPTPENPYGVPPPPNPYGAPPNPYGAAPPPNPYGAPTPEKPYGAPTPENPYASAPASANPYAAPPPPNPYAAAAPAQPNPYDAPTRENVYQNAGMQGTDGTKYFF